MYKLLILLLSTASLSAQSLIFNQLFQPSVRVSGEYSWPNSQANSPYSMGHVQVDAIVPIKSKLGLEVNWKELFSVETYSKLRKFRLRDIKELKNLGRVKLYQLFWTFRPQIQLLRWDGQFGSSPLGADNRLSYGFQTGITGIHLRSKLRFLFYSFNVQLMEDHRSIGKLEPGVQFLVGMAKPKLKPSPLVWFYGLYFSYMNNQFLPVPFAGVEVNFFRKAWLNITLPVQVRLGWQVESDVRIDLLMSLNNRAGAFGMEQLDSLGRPANIRSYYNFNRLRTGLSLTWRLNKLSKLSVEGGIYPWLQMHSGLRNGGEQRVNYSGFMPYVGFSYFRSFKRSLLGSSIDELIRF